MVDNIVAKRSRTYFTFAKFSKLFAADVSAYGKGLISI